MKETKEESKYSRLLVAILYIMWLFETDKESTLWKLRVYVEGIFVKNLTLL